jgi:hypothetical protein
MKKEVVLTLRVDAEIDRAVRTIAQEDERTVAWGVIRAATDLSGDVERALFWYRNEPLQPFGYKTAEQLVSDGRTEDLLRYIESLEAGAAG